MSIVEQPGSSPTGGEPGTERSRGYDASARPQLPPPPAETYSFGRFEPSRRTRWIVGGGAVLGCLGLAAYLYAVDPNVPTNAYPQCPLKALTGIDCPGCGGLRATHALLHGDIVGSLDHNVLAIVIVPLMAYLVAKWVLNLFDVKLPALRLPRWTSWAIPIGVIAFTVVRNIPGWPLYWLNSGSA